MSIRLRYADCGHWISAETAPAGTSERGAALYPVYLCAECVSRAFALNLFEHGKPDPEPVRAKATLKSRED